jgi:replicative DNA helicase
MNATVQALPLPSSADLAAARERRALGIVLILGRIPQEFGRIRKADWSVAEHENAFSVVCEVHQREEPITFEAFDHVSRKRGFSYSSATFAQDLVREAHETRETIDNAQLRQFATMIVTEAEKRRLDHRLAEARVRLSQSAPLDDVLADTARALEDAKAAVSVVDELPPLASARAEALWSTPLPPAIPTSLGSALDNLQGGGWRGVTVLTGPTGRGKSGLVLQEARKAARTMPVLYATTELGERQASARIAAQELNRPWRPLFEGEAATGLVVAHALAPLRLRIVLVTSASQLLEVLQKIADHEKQPPFVVVDYLQGLARSPTEDRRLAVGALSETITAWSRATGGSVLAVSSISRAHYSGADTKEASDFVNAAKESGDVEFDATSVMFLDVPTPPLGGKSEGRLHVAKSRFGTTGTVGVIFDGPTGTFESDPSGGLTEDQRMVLDAILAGAKTWNEIQSASGLRRQKIGPATKALQARGLIGSRPADGVNP